MPFPQFVPCVFNYVLLGLYASILLCVVVLLLGISFFLGIPLCIFIMFNSHCWLLSGLLLLFSNHIVHIPQFMLSVLVHYVVFYCAYVLCALLIYLLHLTHVYFTVSFLFCEARTVCMLCNIHSNCAVLTLCTLYNFCSFRTSSTCIHRCFYNCAVCILWIVLEVVIWLIMLMSIWQLFRFLILPFYHRPILCNIRLAIFKVLVYCSVF